MHEYSTSEGCANLRKYDAPLWVASAAFAHISADLTTQKYVCFLRSRFCCFAAAELLLLLCEFLIQGVIFGIRH
jgi:hypothetical protein